MGRQQNSSDETAGRAARLSLPLLADGTVDWEHIRPSTIQKFNDIIRTDPNIRDTFNEIDGKTANGADLFGGITQENVATGLDLVQGVNALVFRVAAARFVKHPLLRDQHGKPVPLVIDQDVLDRAFKLSEKQHAELDPRATRLAKKYAQNLPEWLKRNLDLYMFASMFLTYTAQNAKAVLETQVKRDLARAQDAFARAQANQPKNPKPDTDVQPVNGHDRAPEPFTPSGISLETDAAAPDAPLV